MSENPQNTGEEQVNNESTVDTTPNTPNGQESTQDDSPNTPNTEPSVDNQPSSDPESGNVASSVADRLQNEAVEEEAAKTAEPAPVPQSPAQFDLAQFTPEQLAQLKSMLNATPDRVTQKKGNIRVEIRSTDINGEEKYLVDFQPAKRSVDYDPESGKETEGNSIRILLTDEADYRLVPYSEFMQMERVVVEVLSMRQKETISEEGQVTQRETGKLVNKEVTMVDYFYTVKLPSGKEVELSGRVINA